MGAVAILIMQQISVWKTSVVGQMNESKTNIYWVPILLFQEAKSDLNLSFRVYVKSKSDNLIKYIFRPEI